MKKESSTRQRLLETAMSLIWESSYGTVSVDVICQKAEIQKGSFYHFFPSKAALAAAAFEMNWEQKQIAYDGLFSPQYSPQERFARYARYLYERQLNKQGVFGRVCGCPYTSLGTELSTQDENLRLVAENNSERTRRYFETALREAVAEGSLPAATKAAIIEKGKEIYAFVIGLLVQAKIENSLDSLKRVEPTLFRLIGFRETVTA